MQRRSINSRRVMSCEVPAEPSMTSEDRMEAVQQLFDEWDLDGSGKIECKELRLVLSAFNEAHRGEAHYDAEWILSEVDTNHDGEVLMGA